MRVVTAVLLAALAVPAWAGRLRTLDPALDLRAAAHFSAVAPGRLMLPESALAETHLLRVVVEQTDAEQLTLGAATDAAAVTLALEGDDLVARRAGAAAAEAPVARWPAKLAAGEITLDASSPAAISIDGKELSGAAAADVVGVKSGPGLLSWAQQMRFGELTVGVRTWLTRAPGPGFAPRAYSAADAKRVGYFAEAPGGAIANRWRPDHPITVVLHAGMPAYLRAEAKAAALSWNAALTTATGQPLVQVEESHDAGLLPGTPDRVVVYWFAEDPGGEMAGTEGLAPSSVDPRTGEIVASHVLLNGPVILGDTRPRDDEAPLGRLPPPRRAPRRIALRLPGGSFQPVRTMPVPCTAGLRRVSKADRAEQAKAARLVRDTLVHEVGHALGLRHNFKGSADLAHLAQGESSTSVMDYLPDLTTPDAPGAYDVAAIQFGYGNKPSDVMGDLFYGTDENQGHDPDVNTFDAGDPLAFYLEEARNLRRAGGGGLEEFKSSLGDTLKHLRYFVNHSAPDRSARAFDGLLASLTRQGDGAKVKAERALAKAVLNAAAPPKKGDDDEEPAPYQPLTQAQREAMQR